MNTFVLISKPGYDRLYSDSLYASNINSQLHIFHNNMTVLSYVYKQGSYRPLECLKVLEIHHCLFKALKSFKNSTF